MKGNPGNGFHVNVSMSHENGIESVNHMIAGVLERVCEMTVFLNPTENSYARFGENKAPAYVSWSKENRSQLIRVPASPSGSQRAELRSPDPSANPYIAFALVIYAALEGLKKKTPLMPPADVNLFRADAEALSSFKKLPPSLKEACKAAISSDFIKSHVPETIINMYCNR